MSRDSEVRAMSARETMIHRLEAVTKQYGVTVAPSVWLDDLDAIEAEMITGVVNDLIRKLMQPLRNHGLAGFEIEALFREALRP